ncbi:Creatine kinase, flagellar [Symbiodinium microadriaticum]|uniref:Creatine kinase, flagellar n=1 Tax=Symbiodinium microadriaticum TaxID=2951 RepID=A0A1Q9CYM6_SYMMI|nr:Creatine kinase, flagellar [Symbiodinium microadriaticum]
MSRKAFGSGVFVGSAMLRSLQLALGCVIIERTWRHHSAADEAAANSTELVNDIAESEWREPSAWSLSSRLRPRPWTETGTPSVQLLLLALDVLGVVTLGRVLEVPVMDVTVAGAQGLPEKAYLSLRAGDVRKQTQYKPGECFSFDGKQVPRHLVVDVFEKVGTAQVSISELSNCDGGFVQLQGRDGKIVLDMQAKVRSQMPEPKKRVSRHQAAIDAQQYLEAHSVQRVLQGMVHELLSNRPSDPYSFMLGYIQASQVNRPTPIPSPFQPARGPDEDDLPNWSAMPGRGDSEYPGFPADGSQPLPDLSRHHSTLAHVLKEQPMLYEHLKDVRTPNGVSLAQCIKPGIDNRGHPILRTLGLIAADETCFEVFEPLFRSVMDRWYESILQDVQLPSAVDTRQAGESLRTLSASLLFVQVTCSRNIRGIQMPPSAQREERKEAERVALEALLSVEDELLNGGEYFPLRGSETYPSKPKGMSPSSEQKLKGEDALEGSEALGGEDASRRRIGVVKTASEDTLRGYGPGWVEQRGVTGSSSRGGGLWERGWLQEESKATIQGQWTKVTMHRRQQTPEAQPDATAAGGIPLDQVDLVVRRRLEQALNGVFGRLLQTTERAAAAAEVQANVTKSETLLKSIKCEVWRPANRQEELKTWREWWLQFSTWLLAVEPAYEKDFQEMDIDTPVDSVLMDDATLARSQRLYAVLCSLVKNRPLLIVRAYDSTKEGFEALRMLRREMEPKEKTRSLALMRRLAAWEFHGGQGPYEQLIKYEEALKQYEYQDIREWVLQYESLNAPWSSSLLGGAGSKARGNKDEAQPMDIDRIKGKDSKGKGKDGKGKKGKGGKNDGYKGYGKWSSKDYNTGTGKGKGSKDGKGKDAKGKGKDSKGKGQGSLCHTCGQPGHWKNECPWKGSAGSWKQGVRQVEETSQTANPGSSSAQSTVSTSASAYRTPSTINQIRAASAVEMSTPPGCKEALVYDMTGDDGDLEDFALEEPGLDDPGRCPGRPGIPHGDPRRGVHGDQLISMVETGDGGHVVLKEWLELGERGRPAKDHNKWGEHPVALRRNTLVLSAVIGAISLMDSGPLPPELEEFSGHQGWHILPSGLPVLINNNVSEAERDTGGGIGVEVDDLMGERDPRGHEEEVEQDGTLDNVELSVATPLKELKLLCDRLGVAKSGSKNKVLKRLRDHRDVMERQLATDVAKQLYKDRDRDPVAMRTPVLPSARQQELHALTHQPFAPWCAACVMGRSRQSPRVGETGANQGHSEEPEWDERGDRPPELSPAELEPLDHKSDRAEVERLISMGALRAPRPEEDGGVGEAPFILERLLPGQRVAAAEWFQYVKEMLVEAKLENFENEPLAARDKVLEVLKKKVEVKVSDPFGPGSELEFLKRRYIWCSEGAIMMSGTKHLEGLLDALGHDIKERDAPADTSFVEEDKGEELNEAKKKLYQECVGRLLYLSHTLADIQYSVSVLAGKMAKPTTTSMRWLVRVAGYLKRVPDLGFLIKPLVPDANLEYGGHGKLVAGSTVVLESVSKSIALSSGESEFVAMVSGATELVFLKDCLGFMLKDKMAIEAKVRSDSAAAQGMAQRLGTGRVRHLACGMMWLQASVKSKLLKIGSISGSTNPADLGTKVLAGPKVRQLLYYAGARLEDGTAYGQLEAEEAERRARINQVVTSGVKKPSLKHASSTRGKGEVAVQATIRSREEQKWADEYTDKVNYLKEVLSTERAEKEQMERALKQLREDNRAAGELLEEPQSGLLLSSGLGRHWPEARGVFTNGSGMVVFVNEADHLRMAYQRRDGDVWKALDGTLRLERALAVALEVNGL